jgi:hypothetical protein
MTLNQSGIHPFKHIHLFVFVNKKGNNHVPFFYYPLPLIGLDGPGFGADGLGADGLGTGFVLGAGAGFGDVGCFTEGTLGVTSVFLGVGVGFGSSPFTGSLIGSLSWING